MLKLIVFVFAGQLLLFSSGQSMSVYKRGQRFCGNRLAQALSLICGGQYFDPGAANSKRDYKAPPVGTDFSLSSYLGFSESDKNELDSSPTMYRRESEGIAHECCRNACSFSTLASYCAK